MVRCETQRRYVISARVTTTNSDSTLHGYLLPTNQRQRGLQDSRRWAGVVSYKRTISNANGYTSDGNLLSTNQRRKFDIQDSRRLAGVVRGQRMILNANRAPNGDVLVCAVRAILRSNAVCSALCSPTLVVTRTTNIGSSCRTGTPRQPKLRRYRVPVPYLQLLIFDPVF